MKRMLMFFASLWLGIMVASAQKYHYDVNHDGSVNITDATLVVNKILGNDNSGDVVVGEAVDLGLPSGTLWSNCNIGANNPEEHGEYLAWGEFNEKKAYAESTYLLFFDGEYENLGADISGSKYDVARQRWGGNWRMPSKEQFEELINNCTYNRIAINGVYGMKFTSKANGKSIFLPYAGYGNGSTFYNKTLGYYGSSTVDFSNMSSAYILYFGSDFAYYRYSISRYLGQSVRPVRSQKLKDEDIYVDLGLPSGLMWAKYNIGASKPEEYGEYFAWGEKSVKSYYGPSTYQYARQEDNGWYDSATGDHYSFIEIGANISGTQYDVANMRWGDKWRIPTVLEYQELKDNCNYEWTSVNGVQGGKFTSKINGNSIFLPAAGDNSFGKFTSVGVYGNYWLARITSDIRYSYHMTFYSGGTYYGGILRSCGYSVRPVYGNYRGI